MATRFVYHGTISPQGVRNLEVLLAEALKKNTTQATLYLCSSGGDVTAGVGLYNYIRSIPMELDIHCFGVCGSIAVTIFLAGGRRTAEPVSSFCLHASTYIDGPRKGEIAENSRLISLPFERELGWDKSTLHHYFGTAEEKYFCVETAKELEIVHEIESQEIDERDEIINVRIP